MNYDWYKVFNKTEFEALGLVSKNYQLDLEGQGIKNVLVTKSLTLGVLFDDVYLSLELNDKNPMEFEDKAVYIDENDDVWIGYAVEEA